MNQRNWHRRLLTLLFAFFCVQAAALAHSPAIFSKMSLADAMSSAQKDGKLVIVDFMATWCGPCHEMDQTTWSNPTVRNWVSQNAIALQLDVDKDTKISNALKVHSMPTIVVFSPKDQAKELERQEGYNQDVDAFLDWLKALRNGKSVADALKDDVAAAAQAGGQKEIAAREKLAKYLLRGEDYEGATEQYLWLWDHRKDEDTATKALLVPFMNHLAEMSQDARAKFEELRDQAENTNRADWIDLSLILGDQSKILNWFDSVKNQSSGIPPWQGAENRIEAVLVTNSRWADIPLLFKDPLAALRGDFYRSQSIKKTLKRDVFPAHAAAMYAGYLAAGNEDMAQQIADEASQLDNVPDMKNTLVNTAFFAHQLRPFHALWWFESLNLALKVATVIIGGATIIVACGLVVAGMRALATDATKPKP